MFLIRKVDRMNTPAKIQDLTGAEIQRIAEDIYIFGYPLVLMEVTKWTDTATSHPTLHRAPLNRFVHEAFLPRPHDKHAVHANADCLSSSAWLDLGKEPIVLSIPGNERYHLLSFFSGWYEIFETFSPRNSGIEGGLLGFVTPDWSGKLPAGMKAIAAPTETVWIHGLFEVRGAEDVKLVNGLQNQLRLLPFSDWDSPPALQGVPFRMDVNQKAPPREQVERLDPRGFYTRLSRLMKRNPAKTSDTEIIAQSIRIGFVPSEDFAFEMLPRETIQAMQLAVAAAQVRIANAQKESHGKTVNNWSLHTHPPGARTTYLERAAAARSGVAAALAEDILCFHTNVDQTGEPLKGGNRYAINFRSDLTPPVNAFWSITLYDSRQQLVPNSILRNSIGDRDRLRLNADNSLSIHIQHDWPGEAKDSNWLPSPKDGFNLVLRMYWPKRDAIVGIWRPPAVTRAN